MKNKQKYFPLTLEEGNGRLMQYDGHNIQGFVPDQAALLEALRLGQAEGNKLVLSFHPITYHFCLICHTLDIHLFATSSANISR